MAGSGTFLNVPEAVAVTVQNVQDCLGVQCESIQCRHTINMRVSLNGVGLSSEVTRPKDWS